MGWTLRHRSRPGLSACLVALLGAPLAGAAEPRVWPVTDAHTSNITGLAFSPDGRTLATSSLDGSAILWDLARGRPRVTLAGVHAGSVYSVAFSPDGSTVATAHGKMLPAAGEVRLWDAATGALRSTIAATDRQAMKFFSHDGRRIGVVADDAPARTWDVADGRMLTETKLPSRSGPVAFAPDLATIAAAADDRSLRLIEVATGREAATLAGLPNRPLSLAFSPDGKSLACGVGTPMMISGGMGGMDRAESLVKVWDISAETPQERATLRGIDSSVGPITFSPDGAMIVTSSRGGTGGIVWDVVTGLRRATIAGEVAVFAFSPDGKALARAGSGQGVTLHDTETWAITARLEGRVAARIAFLPDGKTLAVGYTDGTVALRALADGRNRLVIQAGSAQDRIQTLAVSRDGTLVAAVLHRGGVRVWDADTGAMRPAFGHDPGEVTALAFADDGKALALGGGKGDIQLWSLIPGAVGTLRGHEGRVVGLAFTPDGKTLVSAGAEGMLKLWDVEARRERASVPVHTARVPKVKNEQVERSGRIVTTSSLIPGAFEDRPIPLTAMALSPDGSTIATGDAPALMNADQVSLRDAATGRERLAFRPGREERAGMWPVKALAFSPDGKWLASAAESVRISDTATGRERLTLQAGFPGSVHALAFSPDGRSLVACTFRGIWIWDLPEP